MLTVIGQCDGREHYGFYGAASRSCGASIWGQSESSGVDDASKGCIWRPQWAGVDPYLDGVEDWQKRELHSQILLIGSIISESSGVAFRS